jgi:gliding motility-associated-like protein
MLNWIFSGLYVLIYCGIQWNSIAIEPKEIVHLRLPLACDLIVDAGPDTNVCAPGGTINLMGSVSGNDIFYNWTPATGLSNPNILTPTATISGPITYTLIAWGVDPDNPNLVVNGDFSAGNTGFDSDYTYVVDIPNIQNEMNPEGTYTVINNPNLVHAGFSACNDHTGGGNMMVVNGAANLQDIWCQTIPISEDTWYNVSAWVASMNPASPAQLQFSINDVPIGNIINAVPTPCVWSPFNATWNSGSNTTAEICILNLNTAPGGNDFAIDDISLVSLCSREDEVTITLYEEEAPEPLIDGPAFLCEGEIGLYTASFPPDPPIYNYQWSIPSGAVILSGQGTPLITILWEDAQEGEICLEIETRCDMNEACFEVIVGTLPEFPLLSGPTSLCPGETATFYTPEQDPDDIYEWIIPSELNIISGENTNEIELEWNSPGEVEICLEITNACGTADNCTILTLYPDYLTLFDTTICAGTTIEINGTIYGNGLYTGIETFTSIAGCDSIVEIEITEATTLEFLVTSNLCPGDSIFLEGAFQMDEGIYTDSFTTLSGCDSIVITEIIITPFDTTWIFSTTCLAAEAGTTITTFNQGNCDSTVISEVILIPADTTVISLFSCSVLDTGLVTVLLSNQSGCDSLIQTTTYLLQTDTTNIFQTTCDPSSVGMSQQDLINISGCDSIVITTVAFLQSDTTLINPQTCFFADTGTISTLFQNQDGCDSLVIVTTSYVGSATTYLYANTCSLQDSGITFTNLTNQYGCDSIIATLTTYLLSDTTYLSASSCDPQDTGVLIQQLTNLAGCDSIVILNTSLLPLNQCTLQTSIELMQPLCFGDTGIVYVQVSLGLQPYVVSWRHTDLAITGTSTLTTTPGNVSISLSIAGSYYIEITSANGLSTLDTIQIDSIAPLYVSATAQTDIFGYNITCPGEETGVAFTSIDSPGAGSHSYEWSEGSTIPQLNQLSAGMYSVTVTDANGCKASASVVLTEPLPMQYVLLKEDIHCFGQEDGSINLSNITGGVQPWETSLNGQPLIPSLLYTDLSAGLYTLLITDQQGCKIEEEIVIEEPEAWSVTLGSDTTIAYGNSITLNAHILGQPTGAPQAMWSDGECDGCFSRTVSPLSNTEYSIMLTDENGCTATGRIQIQLFIDRNLYVPNVFSPNGDQINDYFLISSASGIEEIEELSIYDRWGALVFQDFNFLPNDQNRAWDGTMRGEPFNPGVYVYKLIARYIDGKTFIQAGDVTLIK